MATVNDVPAGVLIKAAAEEMKKSKTIQPPEWAKFVRTGVHSMRPPSQDDWWYTRCAALLRTIYLRGPIGTERLRTKYGGRKKRGTMKEHFRKGSGNIIRKCLQQLEKEELVKKADKKSGRVITDKGKSMLDNLSTKIAKKV